MTDKRFWIKKYRAVLNHWICENPKWYMAWDILLLESDENGNVLLTESQAKQHFTRSAWNHFINKLEDDGMLKTHSEGYGRGRKTYGVIINYSHYQGSSKQDVPKTVKDAKQSKKSKPVDNKPAKQKDVITPQSSEDRFAQYMNGQSVSYTQIEQWREHLKRLTGNPKFPKYQSVRDTWQDWYKNFGIEFVELAWQESQVIAAEKGIRRDFAFIELFTKYGENKTLSSYVIQKQKEKLNRISQKRKQSNIFNEGDVVTFQGQQWEVLEITSDGQWLYLENGSEWIQAKPSEVFISTGN